MALHDVIIKCVEQFRGAAVRCFLVAIFLMPFNFLVTVFLWERVTGMRLVVALFCYCLCPMSYPSVAARIFCLPRLILSARDIECVRASLRHEQRSMDGAKDSGLCLPGAPEPRNDGGSQLMVPLMRSPRAERLSPLVLISDSLRYNAEKRQIELQLVCVDRPGQAACGVNSSPRPRHIPLLETAWLKLTVVSGLRVLSRKGRRWYCAFRGVPRNFLGTRDKSPSSRLLAGLVAQWCFRQDP